MGEGNLSHAKKFLSSQQQLSITSGGCSLHVPWKLQKRDTYFIVLAKSLHQFSPNPISNAKWVSIVSEDLAAK